jgi:hypothetical protein
MLKGKHPQLIIRDGLPPKVEANIIEYGPCFVYWAWRLAVGSRANYYPKYFMMWN